MQDLLFIEILSLKILCIIKNKYLLLILVLANYTEIQIISICNLNINEDNSKKEDPL